MTIRLSFREEVGALNYGYNQKAGIAGGGCLYANALTIAAWRIDLDFSNCALNLWMMLPTVQDSGDGALPEKSNEIFEHNIKVCDQAYCVLWFKSPADGQALPGPPRIRHRDEVGSLVEGSAVAFAKKLWPNGKLRVNGHSLTTLSFLALGRSGIKEEARRGESLSLYYQVPIFLPFFDEFPTCRQTSNLKKVIPSPFHSIDRDTQCPVSHFVPVTMILQQPDVS
ncbi:hypothetical protein NC652_018665 [Populus alba x Populus x berolinensis]|nr:hypothetical protein NC652_018665 [Populus alba x Populus x berolinensis]